MPKTTSKSTLSLITQTLTAEQKLNKPDPFCTEKSPEHPRSPSSASEEENATTKQNQRTDADEVSRELDMEGGEMKRRSLRGRTNSRHRIRSHGGLNEESVVPRNIRRNRSNLHDPGSPPHGVRMSSHQKFQVTARAGLRQCPQVPEGSH